MNNNELQKRKLADIDVDRRTGSDNPAWTFLAEVSLSDILADQGKDELTEELWVQTVCDLGLPLVCVENIKKTLTGFVRDIRVDAKPCELEAPGRMRLFCLKKMIDDLNSTKVTRSSHANLVAEQIKMNHQSTVKMDGGWGYFVIERAGKCLTGSAGQSRCSIDLYLYKEGD